MPYLDALFGCLPRFLGGQNPSPQAFVEAPLRWASKAHQLLGDVGPQLPKVGPPHVMGNPNIYKPHNIVGIDRIINPNKNP